MSSQPLPLATTSLSEAALAWLALVLTPGLGARRVLRALQPLDDAAAIFRMPLTALEAMHLPAASARFVAEGRARQAAEQEWTRVEQAGSTLMTFADADYPERLREIFDPPPVLWVRGDRALLSRPAIAVVGTRHPSPYGIGMAEMLARDLAARRLVILSGMARGVDTAAHKGALSAGGMTVAVWGTGIDVVYPKENKRLAEEILMAGGTIVAEQPLGTFPAPQNFPMRNRIISGMSVGVLVVEAAEQSGTRVTARCALEQNRDIYAVPGNVTNKNAWGPNTLIKQGAKLTATWEDIWEDLPSQIRMELEFPAGDGAVSGQADLFASADGGNASVTQVESQASAPESKNALTGMVPPGMSPQEQAVFGRLRLDEATQIEDLIESLNGEVTSAEVFTALFELELNNRIRQLPGKHYLRRF